MAVFRKQTYFKYKFNNFQDFGKWANQVGMLEPQTIDSIQTIEPVSVSSPAPPQDNTLEDAAQQDPISVVSPAPPQDEVIEQPDVVLQPVNSEPIGVGGLAEPMQAEITPQEPLPMDVTIPVVEPELPPPPPTDDVEEPPIIDEEPPIDGGMGSPDYGAPLGGALPTGEQPPMDEGEMPPEDKKGIPLWVWVALGIGTYILLKKKKK